MRFRYSPRWKNDDHSLDGLVFFAQRLDEMLFDLTLDTYKPAALNAPFLCREAISLIGDIESSLIEGANLDHVLAELEWSMQGDKIANSLLDGELSYYILRDENVTLADKKIKLEILSCTLDPQRYLDRCFQMLYDNIKANNKKTIEFLLGKMITTLINIGFSKTYIGKAADKFFYDPNGVDITLNAQFFDFVSEFEGGKKTYDVLFVVSGLINEVSESVRTFNTQIFNDLPDPFKQCEHADSINKDASQVYVVVKSVSLDPYSAKKYAERTLDRLSDLFTLFYHRKQITWHPQSMVALQASSEVIFVDQPKGPMERGFDLKPERASKELNYLLRNFSARGRSFETFNRVADLHGICLSAEIPENQLVNLWTALETIVPSHVGSGASKIKGIISAITPFLLLNYINRIVLRFTQDLFFWDKWKTKKILRKVTGAKGISISQRVFNLLAIETNQHIREELYSSLKDFYLLRHRAFQLSETMKSPERIKEMLEAHELKVGWQLRRIYRTRNLIVHSGMSLPFIDTLIENGHDYLDQLLVETMYMSCNDYKIKTLHQAFEIAKVRYVKFSRSLSQVKSFDESNSIFIMEKKLGSMIKEA